MRRVTWPGCRRRIERGLYDAKRRILIVTLRKR